MDNKKFYFPLHFDSGNRGCEAIARGTIKVLKLQKCEYVALSSDINLDKCIGLASIATLYSCPTEDSFTYKLRRKAIKNKEKKKTLRYKHLYNNFINLIDRKSIAFLTGGDMLCYEDNEVNYINNELHSKKIKTALWACSVGEENLTTAKIETLKNFSVITARESTTEHVLKVGLGLKNIYLFPDPAFALNPELIRLPVYFESDCIGINFSNFVGANVGFDTMFGKNIICLFEYIIQETNFNVILIPHVFWKGQDDRVVCNAIFDKFKNTGKVYLLNTENMNYCQIRYAISKCRFFIGARTHSMISAYSTCVPALALGYSVKSRGIAKDLGLPDDLVVNYKDLKYEAELTDRFQYLLDHETEIREHLGKVMPEYCKRAYSAKDAIKSLERELL